MTAIGGLRMGIAKLRRDSWIALAAALTCISASLVGAAPAAADTTITVNTTSTTFTQGDRLCSLAEAVDYSDGGTDSDCSTAPRAGTTTIVLPAGKYIVPSTLEFDYPTDVVGAGAASTDIDGNDARQVINIDSTAFVTISGVEISDGNSGSSTAGCTGSGITLSCPAEPGIFGGGIDNLGTLTLRDASVMNNHAGGGTQPIGLVVCFSTCNGSQGGAGGGGGGIYNVGTLTVDQSTISDNTAGDGAPGENGRDSGASGVNGGNGASGATGGTGGAIYNDGGSVVITDSTIAGNSAGSGGAGGNGSAGGSGGTGGSAGSGGGGSYGGGVSSAAGYLTVTASTFTGNKAGNGGNAGTPGTGSGGTGADGNNGYGGDGGAIYDGSAPDGSSLTNTTLVGNATGREGSGGLNTDGGEGGGIYVSTEGETLTNVTIAGNTAYSSLVGGGGILLPPVFASATERNSVIASNTAPVFANCGVVPPTDGGHNLVFPSQDKCDGTVGDPKLRALANNGGPTQTMALGPGSAAINLVPVTACALTTDQRGVSRPQGSGCDAGAYEVAPPTLGSPSLRVTGPSSATISGSVMPNLTDTKVSLHYGTTSSYGGATTATDVGSGSGATPFAVKLTALEPHTTYHVQVLATNTDGTSSSSDLTLTTPVALAATVLRGTVNGDVVSVRLSCTAGGGTCVGALKLSSRVTTKAGKVVAVAASDPLKKPKRRTVVRTVGSGRYTVAAGRTKVIKLSLDATGKALLKARDRLPALLTTSGTARITKKVTFVYKPKRSA